MPSPLQSSRNHFANYDAEDAHGNVTGTLKLLIHEEPLLSREQILDRVGEKLPVETLHNRSVLTGSTTVYKILLDYLLSLGVEYIHLAPE